MTAPFDRDAAPADRIAAYDGAVRALRRAQQSAFDARAAAVKIAGTIPPIGNEWPADQIACPKMAALVDALDASTRECESIVGVALIGLAPWTIATDFDCGIGGRERYIDDCYKQYAARHLADFGLAVSREHFEGR